MSAAYIEQAKENIYSYVRELAHTHVVICQRAASELGLRQEMDSWEPGHVRSSAYTLEETELLRLKRLELEDVVQASYEKVSLAFYNLLWHRQAEGNSELLADLDIIIYSPGFKADEGLLFINRCFYSICNRWHSYSGLAKYIAFFIRHLDDLAGAAHSREKRILRERMRAYRESSYADHLRRQMRLNEVEKEITQKEKVGDYLPDLFYLYRTTTRTPDIEALEDRNKRANSGLRKRQYRKLVCEYRAIVDYYNRKVNGEADLPIPIKGMSKQEFDDSLHHYHPLRKASFNQVAESIRKPLPALSSEEAYLTVQNYVMRPCHPFPKAVRERLKRNVHSALNTLEEVDYIGDSGVIAIFKRILYGILLPDRSDSSIQRLKENIQNAGVKELVSVVLSIVLACPMIRYELEKILGFLYEYFESSRVAVEKWLIDFFQHINLALVTNAKQLRYFELGIALA